MHARTIWLLTLVNGLILALSLLRSPAAEPLRAENLAKPPPPDPWLKGTSDEKFTQTEKHFRGLDVAMAEIGYRYGELLTAARERNYEYAQYQTEKIDLSLRLALERRPNRAKSSEPFLGKDLPEVLAAAKKKDGDKLDRALTRLHESCVECHKSEEVLYFKRSVERIRDRAMNAGPPEVRPPIKSGPAVGAQIPGDFAVHNLTVGRKEDVTERFGAGPTVMIFFRGGKQTWEPLLKRVEEEVSKPERRKVNALIVLLNDGEPGVDDDAKDTLKRVAPKITHVGVDNPAGPKGWNIAKDGFATIVLYEKRKIEQCTAFREIEWDEAALNRVAAAIAELGKKQ